MAACNVSSNVKRKKIVGRMCCAGSSTGRVCPSTQYTKDVSLHYFPDKLKDSKRHEAWKDFVTRYRPAFKPSKSKSSSLCSLHFEDSCFATRRDVARELGIRIRLNKDAVPTIDAVNIGLKQKAIAKTASARKVPIQNNSHASQPRVQVSKRKLARFDKPRKVLKTDTNISYERRNESNHVRRQHFSPDAFQFTSTEEAPAVVSLNDDDTSIRRHARNSDDRDYGKSDRFSAERQDSSDELPCGPQAFGLVPVRKPPSPATACHCNCHTQLAQKFAAFEKKFTLLQNKHDILQQSHDKLSQLVEAQNHLLACHTAPPPTREAQETFTTQESQYIMSPEILPAPSTSPRESTPRHDSSSHPRPFAESPDLPPEPLPNADEQSYTLPRRATARDIIRLWEEGSRTFPPVKNWTPAQKMKAQSKLARWKRIIDILKTDCNGDMTLFEERYSNGNGDLLPVTTILALHENQLSSQFLSKGYSNVKQNTIELKSPAEIKSEFDNEPGAEGGIPQEAAMPDNETTNRYVLPRKVTARDVVHLWEVGCDEFPAIATWSKAQKIGQETKIFRWKKIVDLFKTNCNSDWELFCERYSNDKGELLPLATILAKHEAMFSQEHVNNESLATGRNKSTTPVTKPVTKPETTLVTTPARSGSPPSPASTANTPKTSESPKPEQSARDSDGVILPRKVTAFEVVRYWTDGCETFGPVKDWTRTQKMGQETKISRWKKIYEIFRFQCCRDWDEFCRRYTNQRGELLPIATILAKYEAENPTGPPSYKQHENDSHDNVTPGFASQVIGDSCATSFTDNGYTLPQAVDIEITVADTGEYVLPEYLTAVQALSLWEHGTDQVPPMKNWTEAQTQQLQLLDSIRRLAEIFERDCDSHFRRFLDRFSDTDGELLPIAGIIYSKHCRKYSPFFTEYRKSAKNSRTRGEQFELPKRVGAKEIVWLWDHGCRDFPPVKTWSSAQKLRYTTKLSRWRKIADIFHEKCDSNWRIYEEKYSNANGDLLALSTVISMQDELEESESYASMIKRSPNHNGDSWPNESQSSGISIEMNNVGHDGDNVEHGEGNMEQGVDDVSTPKGTSSAKVFYLPKKVNALDIIHYWEHGFGDLPPVSEWNTLQRFRQRSKISRWNKIYDIYKFHCHGNLAEFEQLYSDESGQLLPATTIISMYESRVDADQYNENETPPRGPVVRKYALPRKVDAKDIVRLWEEGNEQFPPIAAWTKADKIGQETKIFRWKKIVDIFKNHCDCDWEYFEDLFSNEFGELLPTSAIIAKFETSFLKR